MTPAIFNKEHTFKPNRDAEMLDLISRLKAYGLPTTWRTLISETSITLTSPKRKRILKFDAYRTLTVDVLKTPIQVTSTVETFKTVDALWLRVEHYLNKYNKPTLEIVNA